MLKLKLTTVKEIRFIYIIYFFITVKGKEKDESKTEQDCAYSSKFLQ